MSHGETEDLVASDVESEETMVNTISRLPYETISHILSFLTIRDAFRARLSTVEWLNLPDFRSVLHFDHLTVFGEQNRFSTRDRLCSKFLGIVDQFMVEVWRGNRICKLLIEFSLGNEHAPYIDRWIETSIRMEVEEIHLNFWGKLREEEYVFPSHLLDLGKAPYLKGLSLSFCKLNLSSECRSWLSNLTTLHLSHVALGESGFQHIRFDGTNLVSLALSYCSMSRLLIINCLHLRRLKKLSIDKCRVKIQLNCPSLEVFEYFGLPYGVTLVDVPNLREVTHKTGSSRTFDHFTRNAPKLEALSLKIQAEINPSFATLARCSLKKLILVCCLLRGPFDLLDVTYMLNACSLLQTIELQLQLSYSDLPAYGPHRECPDQPHLELKKVKFFGSLCNWNVMDLAIYVLKNAVALEQMVIQDLYSAVEHEAWMPLQEVNTTAEVIIHGHNDNEDNHA